MQDIPVFIQQGEKDPFDPEDLIQRIINEDGVNRIMSRQTKPDYWHDYVSMEYQEQWETLSEDIQQALLRNAKHLFDTDNAWDGK